MVVAAGALAAALYFRNSSAPPPLSTPDELYHMVTGSKPALTDALTGHDANSWQEDTILEGGCKYQGGAYHSYVFIKTVHECLANAAPSFRCSTTFAVQVDRRVGISLITIKTARIISDLSSISPGSTHYALV